MMYVVCTYIGFLLGLVLAGLLHQAKNNNNDDNDK